MLDGGLKSGLFFEGWGGGDGGCEGEVRRLGEKRGKSASFVFSLSKPSVVMGGGMVHRELLGAERLGDGNKRGK